METEVRALVSRVLDGVLDGPATTEPRRADADDHTGPEGRVAIGADHGGYEMKEDLARFLRAKGWAVDDCGTGGRDACDHATIPLHPELEVLVGVEAVRVHGELGHGYLLTTPSHLSTVGC